MGLYDSLLVTWQDAAVEVQTKHLHESMATFRPGDRLVPAAQAPGWQVFVEDFQRDNRWPAPDTRRWLIALTWNGVWLDHGFAGAGPVRRAAVIDGLMRVWRDPRYAAWAHGRWAEWFADGRAFEDQAWTRQWSLLQQWQGGPMFPSKNRAPVPLGPLERDVVTRTMEEALAERGRHRLRHEIGWPRLGHEQPTPTDPNATLFDEPVTGFAEVPPPRSVSDTRWTLAAEALTRGDWGVAEHLVQRDRPSSPVPLWQEALDQTLAAVMPSRVLQPLAQRLLEWGACPPEQVQDLPLPVWAIEEQGWGLDLLIPLRRARPEQDWVAQWRWWGQNGYRQAWADHPSDTPWLTQDAKAWCERCAGEPTAAMAHVPQTAWEPWTAAGGRLSAQDPANDPLMHLLSPDHPAPPAHVLWMIERRDPAGWKVKHLPEIAARLRALDQIDAASSYPVGWSPVLARFEQELLRRTTPRLPRSPRKSRSRL